MSVLTPDAIALLRCHALQGSQEQRSAKERDFSRTAPTRHATKLNEIGMSDGKEIECATEHSGSSVRCGGTTTPGREYALRRKHDHLDDDLRVSYPPSGGSFIELRAPSHAPTGMSMTKDEKGRDSLIYA